MKRCIIRTHTSGRQEGRVGKDALQDGRVVENHAARRDYVCRRQAQVDEEVAHRGEDNSTEYIRV